MAENPKFDEYKSQIIRMLDTMFELPGLPDVTECVITKESVTGGKPLLISGTKRRMARLNENTEDKPDAS